MRSLIAVFCLAGSALTAWEFTPTPVCTFRNQTPVAVEVTFDGQLYAIHLTRAGGWPDAPIFSLQFDGPAGLRISTDRHRITGDTLTVTDTGFGNVLNGFEFNDTATALIGDLAVPLDLDKAAPAVRAFRDCLVLPTV
ncbi:hypothetical protein KUH32_09495 [Thalassococcus sp. CAU 1522]|uniref:Excinuclease ABC subunit B n=1 Tax=Thalassococcus arenae TaxID=2851652 RepID=A0ABS6N7L0_9RHOB|nr:hypothetical protein [Thalassococcus arenae]MBV2360008.1 hypothetical protein [Thalassococcus arenae]